MSPTTPQAPLILAIDTSCDETSVAVTRGFNILSNTISSQVRQHAKFGGVVPMLAARLHEEKIGAVIEIALRQAKVDLSQIEVVAVTYGPGLAPALQTGIAKAKQLARELDIPLYGVNHMHGHLTSVLAKGRSVELPILALLASGGHTELLAVPDWNSVQLLGETLDDAVGEAFDKVAKMLGLGYPGGKVLSALADAGNEHSYMFPIPMKNSGDLNFSYSGLKNAVRLQIEKLKNNQPYLSQQEIQDIAASFRSAAFAHLRDKVSKALFTFPETKTLVLAGGVAANTFLRSQLRHLANSHGVKLVFPTSSKLCTDNAAMIGISAWVEIEAGKKRENIEKLDRVSNLRFAE